MIGVLGKYLAVKGFEQTALLSRHNSWCHSFSRASAGTLSVCMNEKTADHPVHVAALQFLSTVFTEETKSRGAEVPTSTSKRAAALRDIVNAPPASQLCEMLLQVCGGGGVLIINYLAAIKIIYTYVCVLMTKAEKTLMLFSTKV